VELHIFAGAQRVVEALRGHDCGPALAWCDEHRARLRKAKSRLEFKLRVQARAWPSHLAAEGKLVWQR
jgi:macrophage erythroblast attacher